MNFKRQFKQILKVSVTCVTVLMFTLSLVLPYSSAYFSPDSRVSQKVVTSDHEKVEVSTSLLSAPAECPNKVVQRYNSSDRVITTTLPPRPASFLTFSLQKRASFAEAVLSQLLPWRPSIVIALRKLVI